MIVCSDRKPVSRNVLFRIMIVIAVSLACMAGCGGSSETGDKEQMQQPGVPSFESIVGIDYHEVRRTFDTGVSYDSLGFVQAPEWHLRFATPDSILIYSPEADDLVGYKIHHDHDAYFHFARESWRVVELHPDSITLQLLSLRGLKVDRIKSNVYMKFYSDTYINEHIGEKDAPLNEKIEELRKPSRQDTAFVRSQIELANRNPHEPDSAFASRNFARLESTNPALSIRKKKLEYSDLTGESPAYEYLYPEYFITIDHAYQDFGHDFSVVVDEHGKMHLGKVFVMEEFVGARNRVVQGIIDVYLHNWLEITPAHTMGMPHSSVVYLYVKGRTSE